MPHRRRDQLGAEGRATGQGPALPHAAFLEAGDRWELDVGGKQIDRCAFGFVVELLIDSGDNSWEVALGLPFMIHHTTGTTTRVEPLTGENVDAVLPLLHQEVRSAMAYKDGRFALDMADGTRVEAPAGEGFEPWTLNGPDRLLVVSLPDGGLSIWDD